MSKLMQVTGYRLQVTGSFDYSYCSYCHLQPTTYNLDIGGNLQC